MQQIRDIISLIDRSIQNDPSLGLTSWGIIKDGYDTRVDELRFLVKHSNQWLSDYTGNIIQETWIASLKVKYTAMIGYFIEIPLSQKSKAPEYFLHKTTLVNALRFTTKELQEFEGKMMNAESQLFEREYELFWEICKEIGAGFLEVKKVSKNIATLDFLSNLSEIAYENNYIKPEIHEWYDLEIVWGRHPVVEKIEKNFISNELFLDHKKFVHIITWPNMWGKSTYLRQNALIILMAHMGSFVPAKSAKIPLTDKIFSRVWASDNLYESTSTFMVEMQEVANILNNSTQKSFVIIDEVGRGTSTYDGMSLAWAILKENHDKIQAKTLFATHYHELVDESKKLTWVGNFSVAIAENDENIVFLRKIVPGGIKKSYGIEVAKLAWVPIWVIQEANNFLQNFENKFSGQLTLGNFEAVVQEKIVYQEKESEIEKELKEIDINHLTPIEALNVLWRWKGKIK